MVDEKFLKNLLENNDENEIIEFKKAANSYDFEKIGKYFSALSNEANLSGKKQAWLVFGIEDGTKRILGTNFKKDRKDLNSLKKDIANGTNNRITFIEIHEINVDGKRVLVFQIPAAPRGIPIAWKGHYYGRDNESLNSLNIEEIERLRKQNNNEDWSAEICENATVEDLSQEAISLAKKAFGDKNPHLKDAISSWDVITFLNKSKLCIKGKITRAAIILLGKTESEHFISPSVAKISWILKDRDGIEKDYTHFSCPFLLNINEIFNKIRILKYRYLPEGSLFPEEVDSYDPYIIREALNNCIAHQDYSLCGKINVVEKEDSILIFSNKGSFIPGSVENVINADSPESLYRNRFLAEAMVNLKMIDTIGSGIKKMFTIQRNKFFPLPEYFISKEEVKVIITGKVLDINYARKLAQMPELTLNEIILLDKVQKNKELNNSDIKTLRDKNLIEGRKPNIYIFSCGTKYKSKKRIY